MTDEMIKALSGSMAGVTNPSEQAPDMVEKVRAAIFEAMEKPDNIPQDAWDSAEMALTFIPSPSLYEMQVSVAKAISLAGKDADHWRDTAHEFQSLSASFENDLVSMKSDADDYKSAMKAHYARAQRAEAQLKSAMEALEAILDLTDGHHSQHETIRLIRTRARAALPAKL